MLTILTTTNHKNQILGSISSVERLDELVHVVEYTDKPKSSSKILIIQDNYIKLPLDWYDTLPPYIIPPVSFTNNNLLALIFFKIGNHQKAFEYLSGQEELYQHLHIIIALKFGYDITKEMIAFVSLKSWHNTAIVSHYGYLDNSLGYTEVKKRYQDALTYAENDELKLFTAKHYLNLLLDVSEYKETEKMARSFKEMAMSEEAQNAMNVQLASALMAQFKVPHNQKLLDEVQALYQKSIDFYKSKNEKVQAGLLAINASEVANFKKDFLTSKEHINKAILYFREEEIPEFLAEATLKKAILLYTWSKNGNPQYYKPAINAFQDALKVFKRSIYPEKFAEIHHNLALIYSEILVSEEEKPIWNAFCASSFKEALAFYSKEQYPYEYATVSHNYATALLNFPPAKLNNNLLKASELFEEALQIRTANTYPFERTLTLLNQLELYWRIPNKNDNEEQKRHQEMFSKALEIKKLVSDKNLLKQADNHLKKLDELRTIIN
ncbi:hypothetical protein [Aquimarina celericrescens]|uniref:Uncharacterized protein n=1 Tax=Aquimarina celericrescens TaxID=1964542 RepID=A0ABW5AS54_9FLAO|nr:hypothetical protein [Aquimarina celericrescens]